MRRWIVLLFCASISVLAADVEVTAERFFADEKAKKTLFEGSVTVVKAQDTLKADKVTIEFDAKRQPLRYIASGSAKVKLLMNGKRYYGEAEVMTYTPQTQIYTLEKKAFLHEIDTDKKVYGDFIKADQLSGQYEVDGKGKGPVKFIFKLEDSKK